MRGAALALAVVASVTCMGASAGDLGAMKFMLGTWSCSGQAIDGTPFHITETTKLSPDGSRLVTHDSSGKVSTELYYDAARKLWVENAVNGNDGSNSIQTSPGWTGNSIVFIGQVNINGVQSLGYRSTWTKLSESETKQTDELQGPNGWMQFDSALCAKAR